MRDWIPFDEGEYLVERAFLLAPDGAAVLLEDAVIRVFFDRQGQRRMNGGCRIRNILLVELMDDHDHIHLALDLGGEFKYLLKDPTLQAGKVFSPDVKSTLQFAPQKPWEQLPGDEFEALWSRLKFLSE